MREEKFFLEPAEIAPAGRAEVNIHEGAILNGPDGIDWGDYEVNAFLAKRDMGEVSVDDEIPNRTIQIPLVLGATGDFDAARIAMQAWAASVNTRGGTLKRELIGGSYGEAGSKLFCDCIKATLKLGGGTPQMSEGVDPDAVLTIEALPDFYGEYEEEAAFSGTGDASKTFIVKGNLPGRAAIIVNEKSGHDQLGLLWHFRRDGYSATAPWAMNVEGWEPIGAATKATLAGSAGTKVVTHSNLGTQWTGVAAKTMPHHGFYDVWVRAYTTSFTPPEARLIYDVGDLVDPAENIAIPIPGSPGYYLINLGQVNLEELPIGEHRWRGMLQARGAAGGENISFDRIWFRSILEYSGKPTAPRRTTEGLAAPLVFDGFNQESGGAATGKSPGVGSAYVALTNSDPDDFEVDTETHTLIRKSVSDAGSIAPGFAVGRAIGAGTAKLTNHSIAHDFSLSQTAATGHIVRWVDAENFVLLKLSRFFYFPGTFGGGLSSNWIVQAIKHKGKTVTALNAGIDIASATELSGRMQTTVYEGQIVVTIDEREVFSMEDADLAPGATLDEGRADVYDENSSATAATRRYDNLEILPLSFEAVNFANQQAWLAWKGLYRKAPDGLGFGPIARQTSDLPRVPVSGPEEALVELAVKTSRGDLGQIADSALDPLEVQWGYYPCWSSVPGL